MTDIFLSHNLTKPSSQCTLVFLRKRITTHDFRQFMTCFKKNHKQCVRFIFVLELLYYFNRLLRPIIISFNVHL